MKPKERYKEKENKNKSDEDECTFCNIVEGKSDSWKIYEDVEILGILDINPLAKGHCLIIPKRHVNWFYELEDGEIAHLFKVAKEPAKTFINVAIILKAMLPTEPSSELRNIVLIRNDLFRGVRSFLDENGFCEVRAPILTRNLACVKSNNIINNIDQFSIDYFGNRMYLSQSSQFYLEALLNEFEKVYCIMPSFRKEISDSFHLTEFWHIEIELNHTNLEKLILFQEEFIVYLIDYLKKKRENELLSLNKNIDTITKITTPFPRIKYSEAFAILSENNLNKRYGEEFNKDDEIQLTKCKNSPLFVTNFPIRTTAFHHRIDPNNPDHVLNVDLLAPNCGEICGGGERITSKEELIRRLKEARLNVKDYEWYIKLREENCDVHSGFGMGVERFLSWLCNLEGISKATPYPRVSTFILP